MATDVKEAKKTADDYLKELKTIVEKLEEGHPRKKILANFLKWKRKARGMVKHYIMLRDAGTVLFSITVEGHDPFIAKTIKYLITDTPEATSRFIQT